MKFDLNEIKEALGKTTPGKWTDAPEWVRGKEVNEHYREIKAGKGFNCPPFTEDTGFGITGYISPENAKVMSHAPEWLTFLLERIEWMEKIDLERQGDFLIHANSLKIKVAQVEEMQKTQSQILERVADISPSLAKSIVQEFGLKGEPI